MSFQKLQPVSSEASEEGSSVPECFVMMMTELPCPPHCQEPEIYLPVLPDLLRSEPLLAQTVSWEAPRGWFSVSQLQVGAVSWEASMVPCSASEGLVMKMMDSF